ncbi:MAG: hypothetical protein HY907_15805 [Deltaproteobacteria bacterium]|nr:hypothetical protein [Deltaproteobacteria bacterium]
MSRLLSVAFVVTIGCTSSGSGEAEGGAGASVVVSAGGASTAEVPPGIAGRLGASFGVQMAPRRQTSAFRPVVATRRGMAKGVTATPRGRTCRPTTGRPVVGAVVGCPGAVAFPGALWVAAFGPFGAIVRLLRGRLRFRGPSGAPSCHATYRRFSS